VKAVQSQQLHVLAGIKLLHTAIWFFFAGCIVAIPIAGAWHQFRWAAVLNREKKKQSKQRTPDGTLKRKSRNDLLISASPSSADEQSERFGREYARTRTFVWFVSQV
jgi:hypothetical protein